MSFPLPAWVALTVLAAWLVLGVFVSGINHDESQYAAGATLALHHMIFRDYMSLQPPLQSWVYAPLALLFENHAYLAMRLVTALFGLASVATVYLTLRSIDVSEQNALWSAFGMASVNALQNGSSVVRNDMLPAFLLCLAICAALQAIRQRRVRLWFLVGFTVGLAASSKLSYEPSCLAAGVAAVCVADDRRRTGLAYAAGLAIGIMPALIALADAPGAFLWGVFTYGENAPFDWYRVIGRAAELTWFGKFVDLAGFLVKGPALVALALVVVRLRSSLTGPLAREAFFITAMVVAGLVGEALPTPSHWPYLIPLLPPLFVAFGMMLQRETVRSGLIVRALVAFAAIGLAPTLYHALQAARFGSPILIAEANAKWMRDHIPRTGPTDEITTFSPELAMDTGVPVDDDFAAGPFVFRSGHLLTAAQATALHLIIPSNLEQALDRQMPDAILTGYEARPNEPHLDPYLDAYANRHRYRLLKLPDGVGRLYIRSTRKILFHQANSGLPSTS